MVLPSAVLEARNQRFKAMCILERAKWQMKPPYKDARSKVKMFRFLFLLEPSRD